MPCYGFGGRVGGKLNKVIVDSKLGLSAAYYSINMSALIRPATLPFSSSVATFWRMWPCFEWCNEALLEIVSRHIKYLWESVGTHVAACQSNRKL